MTPDKESTAVSKKSAISHLIILFWLILLLLISFIYSKGLSGSFIFDDFPNIVDSDQLHLKDLSIHEIWRVALSGDAGPLKRPIAVLSFALNIFFTGLNPWYFKITNIIIHILCTIMVGMVSNRILNFTRIDLKSDHAPLKNSLAPWGGLIAAAIWGLHPLNLTSVLYVVQRMTSLATLFGLLALLAYTEIRASNALTTVNKIAPWKNPILGVGTIMLLALSAFCKESGLLFIPIILLVEFFFFQFRYQDAEIFIKGLSLKKWVFYILIFISIFILTWATPKILDNTRIPYREFSTQERLLTQFRVLVFYLSEFFIPQISKMSLYHDDIEISRSLFQPIETILALALLLAISIFSFFIRKKAPAFLFAWLWFLISHSLESSIFPLELVHEHRNYFATIGFCIAIAMHTRKIHKEFSKRYFFILSMALTILGASTMTRAIEWSSPIILAAMEASRHPQSMRANYELGGALLAASDRTQDKLPLLQQATAAFEAAAQSRSQSVSSDFGLLAVKFAIAKEEKITPDVTEILHSLQKKLRELPAEASIPAHISAFLKCQLSGPCSLSDIETISLITAPLENPSLSPYSKGEILKMAAEYSISQANDWNLAQTMVEEAIGYSDISSTRIVYAQILRNQGKITEAKEQLVIAKKIDNFNQYKSAIQRENLLLQ